MRIQFGSLGKLAFMAVLSQLCLSAVAIATTLTVTNLTDDGSEGTLRSRITAAQDGDTIEFEPSNQPATISLSSTLGTLLIGKDLTIIGPGAGLLTISGSNASTVIKVSAGKHVFLENLTIANGGGAVGSGIINRGTLTITNSTISGNTTGQHGHGGGIFNDRGTLTITNSTISGNTTGQFGNGGGVSNFNGSLTITNSTISGNTASQYGHGGGIVNDRGTLTITNSTISGNTASQNGYGGGVSNFNGSLTITNSTISGNTTGQYGYGGGVYTFNGSLTITNSTISGNTTGQNGNGGGVYNYYYADATITNSTISGNTTGQYGDGGGVCNYYYADATITNSTISGNTTGQNGNGGGVANSSYAIATINNSLVLGNYKERVLNEIASDIVSALTLDTYSVVAFGPGQTLANYLEVEPDNASKPLLQDNGGPTQTIALVAGSAAIDRGPLVSDLITDQRGYKRISGLAMDVGAYEYGSCLDSDPTVQNLNDSGAGSLREAIQGVCAGNTIMFAASVTGTIPLTSSIEIGKNLSIKGPGARALTITSAAQVLHVDTGAKVTVSDVTLGPSNGSVVDNFGDLTINRATVTGGVADSGGGINNEIGANLKVSNSTISKNSASSMGGGIYNLGSLTLVNSTMALNSSALGAAIFNQTLASAIIGNSTLSNNTASSSGGGIDTSPDAFVQVNNTIVAGNLPEGSDLIGSNPSTIGSYNLIGSSNLAALFVLDIDGRPLLANNGGPTDTIALSPGSLAVGAGDPQFDGSVLATDQRGQPRIADNRIDIGAYEDQNPNHAPVATCKNVVTSTDLDKNVATVLAESFDNLSTDPESDTLSFLASPAGPYPIGVSDVTLTVSDPYGLSSSCTATVTVNDGQTPTLITGVIVPAIETTGSTAVVNFPVFATDNSGEPITYQYTVNGAPVSSGSSFPIGTTHVVATATDAAGNSTPFAFDVSVLDKTRPALVGLPTSDMKLIAVSGEAVLVYSISATDNSGTAVTVVCNPPSGTRIGIGTTTVRCTATDASLNTTTGSFKVNVVGGGCDASGSTGKPSADALLLLSLLVVFGMVRRTLNKAALR